MDITEDPDPAMATTAETPPFTTVDTDIPTTVDTDIPITVDTDTILIRTGAGSTPKVTPDRASRTSRLATGSSRRCARPTDFRNVSSAAATSATKARCRIRRRIKLNRLRGR